MRGKKRTSNHRRIKRRTIRSRKHQNRRKTFKKGGGSTYADYLDYMKDTPNAKPMSKEQWQEKWDAEHKDDDKLDNPEFYFRNAPKPFNPYL